MKLAFYIIISTLVISFVDARARISGEYQRSNKNPNFSGYHRNDKENSSRILCIFIRSQGRTPKGFSFKVVKELASLLSKNYTTDWGLGEDNDDDFVLKGDREVLSEDDDDDFVLKGDRKVSDGVLEEGNTTANAFSVKISRDEPVSELKKAIKAEKAPKFDHFLADKLKLWKVSIPGDHLDDQLKNLKLNDSDELSAIKKISKYLPDSPAEEHIHVLVEPPSRLPLRAANRNYLIASSMVSFDIVVSPKRTKGFKWTVDIDNATLDGLKEYIREMEKPPALENDGAVLNFISSGERYSPRNDQDLCKMLRLFVSNNSFKFTVLIETPSKPFNEWTFPKVCELYGLSDDPNPSIDVHQKQNLFIYLSRFRYLPVQGSSQGRTGEVDRREKWAWESQSQDIREIIIDGKEVS
ncbi:hypothetical protein RhiirA4_539787 [Rhizophagus irregularis]|uniref:Crinkler effector protein N-terminal domain-containing protein n=1 Tax=Rhizophagus irregularis TaxID=588596 RepID=A0A2I1G4W7_9GLOM|nr:hypothetical protein RhiirA4_539787 [Rhizophagus irregularis]